MKKKSIGIIHHGCAKNLVDTELMIGMLEKAGYKITLDTYGDKADTVIINTCSFIHDAEKESIESIFNAISEGKKIIVTGCLAQKHKKELKKLIPEINSIIGISEFTKIVDAVESDEFYSVSDTPQYCYPEDVTRSQITIGSSSYIKIADGCNYKCGYCVIPDLRGKYKSRSIEAIVDEAKHLADKGVAEIILVAQDTTSYGIDLYKKPMLAELLHKLNEIENISWIRVLYAYPTNFDDNLIEAFKTLDKVVKYIDIPLQHSHPDVLKRMKRPVLDLEKFLLKLRKEIKDLVIRTTFIVGYPQETQEEFEHLYNFIKKMKFERLGVFEYCREKNTYSYSLKPQIPQNIKAKRKKEILKMQQGILEKINASFISKEIPCIIEEVHSDGTIVARSYGDAPEVDGLVYIKTEEHLVPAQIVNVKVTGAQGYDLIGEIS